MTLLKESAEAEMRTLQVAICDLMAKGSAMTDSEAVEADNLCKKWQALKVIVSECVA